MGNMVGAFGACFTPPAASDVILYASEASVKVGSWQVVADPDGSRRQSLIQSGCGTGESSHPRRKSCELFRDDLQRAGRHALSLLDEKQGAQRLSIQRLCSRAVLRQRGPERSGYIPDRNDHINRDEPGRMLRVRVERMGLAGQRMGRRGSAGAAGIFSNERAAHDKGAGERGRNIDRSDSAVSSYVFERRPGASQKRHYYTSEDRQSDASADNKRNKSDESAV